MSHTIEDAKRNAKRYSRNEAANFIKLYGDNDQIAVYRDGGGYILARSNKAKFLYRHAEQYGASDPDFMGFYGGPDGWAYFNMDARAAA